MLKPTSTFKLSKTSKRMLTQFVNAEERGHWKRMMVQAELAAAIVPKTEKRDRSAPRGTANYQTNYTGTASTAV